MEAISYSVPAVLTLHAGAGGALKQILCSTDGIAFSGV